MPRVTVIITRTDPMSRLTELLAKATPAADALIADNSALKAEVARLTAEAPNEAEYAEFEAFVAKIATPTPQP